MTSDLDLFATTPDPQPTGHETNGAESEPSNRYADVFEFVEDHLVHVYARPTENAAAIRWCPRWHHHPEALARLTALWKAFETLRTDPGTGMSIWWLEHADPTMTALTAHDGPFRDCGPGEHRNPPTLPTVSATR